MSPEGKKSLLAPVWAEGRSLKAAQMPVGIIPLSREAGRAFQGLAGFPQALKMLRPRLEPFAGLVRRMGAPGQEFPEASLLK